MEDLFWIKPDIDNLPDNEVLCVDEMGGYMVGHLNFDNESPHENKFTCDDPYQCMEEVISYMDLSMFDKLPVRKINTT